VRRLGTAVAMKMDVGHMGPGPSAPGATPQAPSPGSLNPNPTPTPEQGGQGAAYNPFTQGPQQ